MRGSYGSYWTPCCGEIESKDIDRDELDRVRYVQASELKAAEKQNRHLRHIIDNGRVDTEILRQALKDIVAQAEVHGFWNAEQKMAEAALDKIEALWKERTEAEKKRRGEE
jgi:hypothetical protein